MQPPALEARRCKSEWGSAYHAAPDRAPSRMYQVAQACMRRRLSPSPWDSSERDTAVTVLDNQRLHSAAIMTQQHRLILVFSPLSKAGSWCSQYRPQLSKERSPHAVCVYSIDPGQQVVLLPPCSCSVEHSLSHLLLLVRAEQRLVQTDLTALPASYRPVLVPVCAAGCRAAEQQRARPSVRLLQLRDLDVYLEVAVGSHMTQLRQAGQ